MLKNIVIVNDSIEVTGGAGKVAISSAVELSRQGFNVFLFAGTGINLETDLIKSTVQIINLQQEDILKDKNRLRAIWQGLWNKKAERAFEILLLDLTPSETIIHFHSWTKVLSCSLFSVTARLNFKIVITLHDYFSFCPNGGFFNYQRKKVCHYTPLSIRCLFSNCDSRSYFHKVWRYIRQVIQNKYLFENKCISFVSISKLNLAIASKILEKRAKQINFFEVKNPIEMNATHLLADVQKNDVFLYIGRLSPEKGIDLFCKLAMELNLNAVVLGDGPMFFNLKQAFPNIKFGGWVSGEEKEKYIKCARVLVFPSLWYEGSPLVIQEIKSYGIPCIVSDVSSAKDEIVDGKDGLIFKSGDINSLKESILKIKNEDITHMSEYIKLHLNLESLSITTHINNLIKIYNTILE